MRHRRVRHASRAIHGGAPYRELADSRGLELLALRDVARLEVPDAVVFSLIMVGWAVLEASSH